MATEKKSVLIEISEEAYKQNTVYRPWKEIKPGETTAPSEVVMITAQWTTARN